VPIERHLNHLIERDYLLLVRAEVIKRLPGVAVRAEILPNAEVLPDATDTATGANPLQIVVLVQDSPLSRLRTEQGPS